MIALLKDFEKHCLVHILVFTHYFPVYPIPSTKMHWCRDKISSYGDVPLVTFRSNNLISICQNKWTHVSLIRKAVLMPYLSCDFLLLLSTWFFFARYHESSITFILKIDYVIYSVCLFRALRKDGTMVEALLLLFFSSL